MPKLTLYLSPRELLGYDKWKEYCEITGTSEWAVNEGQLDMDTSLEMPPEIVQWFIANTNEHPTHAPQS